MTTLTVNYLIVAAGGSGGNTSGGGGSGGGGAGDVEHGTTVCTVGALLTVTVGTGALGANGGNSSFNSITAIGGGLGGTSFGSNGNNGGSGGGSAQGGTTGGTASGSNAHAGGNSGGTNYNSAPGGGGAGAVGGSISGDYGGAGGVGISNSITGTAVVYGDGGGGGGYTGSGGVGGTGNGGHGGNAGGNATAAVPNTGSGGGGIGSNGAVATKGADGIVVITYPSSIGVAISVSGGYTLTTVGSNYVYTFTSSGTISLPSNYFMGLYEDLHLHDVWGAWYLPMTLAEDLKVTQSLSTNSGKTNHLTEDLHLHDADNANLQIVNILLGEDLHVHDVGVGKRVVMYLALEDLLLHDGLAYGQKVKMFLAEDLNFLDKIDTGNPLYSFVVNTMNNSLTKYENFNFNSYAKLNGVFFGAQSDGVYELGADDDNGTPIDMEIIFPKNDLGSEMLKSIPDIYLGAHTDGNLVLMITDDTGKSYYYTMNAQTSGSIRTNRVIVGRGLRSRFFEFTLTNVDGDDLQFDSITFRALELSRRIGEDT